MAPHRGRGIYIFDAIGTLFDGSVLVDRLDRRFPGEGVALAAAWRATQLRMTWLRSLMDAYEPFDRVTRDALAAVVGAAGREATDVDLDDLAKMYGELPVYPEVAEVIETLVDLGSTLAILSNGTPAMLMSLVERSGLRERFAVVLSVDAIRVYKPHPAVYRLASDHFGVAPRDVRFVSGNAWDCAGAKRFGFDVTAIDRVGTGVLEDLGERPDRIGRDLRVLIDADRHAGASAMNSRPVGDEV